MIVNRGLREKPIVDRVPWRSSPRGGRLPCASTILTISADLDVWIPLSESSGSTTDGNSNSSKYSVVEISILNLDISEDSWAHIFEESLLQLPEPRDAMDLQLVGFDVLSLALESYLFSVPPGNSMSEVLRKACRNDGMPYGLFRQFSDAADFLAAVQEDMESHGPFAIFGVAVDPETARILESLEANSACREEKAR